MLSLQGKRILITGLLSDRSIAYGIAEAASRDGAELAFTYVGDEKMKSRVEKLASSFSKLPVYPCDVSKDDEIDRLFPALSQNAGWEQIDGIVHAIAFAPREAISGDFLDGLSRESFLIAHDISAYSFAALAKAARSYLSKNASLLTLTYLGSERVVPNYNTMGLAKASLEASVRYLATSLGNSGVRVNAISSGPIKTLAASGIKGFSEILNCVKANSPLKRNVTTEQVGNAASFLLSELSSGISGQIIYVDSGFNSTIGTLDKNDTNDA